MRLARAMRRKAEKSAAVGDRRAAKTYAKAKKAVRHATTHELVMQAAVRRQAVVEIMATIVVAMHRSFGWSTDRLLRLRKKNAGTDGVPERAIREARRDGSHRREGTELGLPHREG